MKTRILTAVLLALAGSSAQAQFQYQIDPLAEVAADMRAAARHLDKRTTGEPTQQRQNSAISRLDALIAELEQEREAMMGGSASANPTNPMMDSEVKSGPGGMGKLHAASDEGDRWGELPPHERDRILQSLNDGFPVHYQRILETYYRRLAEEQPVGSSTDSGTLDPTRPTGESQ